MNKSSVGDIREIEIQRLKSGQALEVDELQEEIYYKVMDLYLEMGDTAAATRTYKQCISIFGETVPLFNSPKVSNLLSHLN